MQQFLAALLFATSGAASSSTDKVAVCLPVAKVAWEVIVEVFDEVLAQNAKYQAAKADPSETLLLLAEGMPSSDQCAQAIALFGPEGLKALLLKSSREDLAVGKRPRHFD